MDEHYLEEVWNGRFSDNINDWLQELAAKSISYESFINAVKEEIEEREL